MLKEFSKLLELEELFIEDEIDIKKEYLWGVNLKKYSLKELWQLQDFWGKVFQLKIHSYLNEGCDFYERCYYGALMDIAFENEQILFKEIFMREFYKNPFGKEREVK